MLIYALTSVMAWMLGGCLAHVVPGVAGMLKALLLTPTLVSTLLITGLCCWTNIVAQAVAWIPDGQISMFALPTLAGMLYYLKSVVLEGLAKELRFLFVFELAFEEIDASLYAAVVAKLEAISPFQGCFLMVRSQPKMHVRMGLYAPNNNLPNSKAKALKPIYERSRRSGVQVVVHDYMVLFVWTEDPNNNTPGGLLTESPTLHVATLRFFKRKLNAMVQQAVDEALVSHKENSVGVFRYTADKSTWKKTAVRMARSLDCLALSDEAVMVLDDARDFAKKQEWYAKRNVPYRRGYLLAGPPGTGKTTLIDCVAACCKMDLALIQLSGLTDGKMQDMVLSAPQDSILVFEDIDCMTEHTSTESSLAGLLNVIDGLDAQTGRLVFFTTNHPERLSEAFLRAGRCDVKAYFGHATHDQIVKLFRIFYDEQQEDSHEGVQQEQNQTSMADNAERFAALVEPCKLVVASLQTHFTKCSKPEDAIAAWRDMLV